MECSGVIFIFVAVSSSYYDKSGQYGTGERRDTQLRSRFVAKLSIVEFSLAIYTVYLRCACELWTVVCI